MSTSPFSFNTSSATTSADPIINVSTSSYTWPYPIWPYPPSSKDNHLRWVNRITPKPRVQRSKKKIDERKMRRLMWRKRKR